MTTSIEENKTYKKFLALISNIKYKDWEFSLDEGAGGFLLRVEPTVANDFTTANRINGIINHQLPSSWYISKFSTDTEVVRTVYKAVCAIENLIVTDRISEWWIGNDTEQLEAEMKVMPVAEQLEAVANAFKYQDWLLHTERRDGGIILQVRFLAEDNDKPGVKEMQHCRKFFVNNNDTDLDALELVWYAVRLAEEHERDEQFRYKDVSVYNPHISYDLLIESIEKNGHDTRSHQPA